VGYGHVLTVNRRQLLGTAAIGIAASVAGCSTGSDDSPESDPDPEPAASELRLSIKNNSEQTQSATFLLGTTRDRISTVVGFDLADIEPSETRTRDPERLDPGAYTLETELSTLSMRTETSWVGHECPIKHIEIELRPDGFRIQNECLEE